MKWPGEALVQRMWETVAERGVGGLLRPWQIRREGRAQLDVRREEILLLAQAEKDAEGIRDGRLRALTSGDATDVVTASAANAKPPESTLAQMLTARILSEEVRKELNVTRALLSAESELAEDASEPPTEKPDADWIYRWRDAASSVTTEELQALWGRVLAGEIKAPGSVSIRTLEFLRNLSQLEAKAIEQLSPLVVSDFLYREDNWLKDSGIDFAFLLQMQELGLVSGVEAIGMSMTITTQEEGRFRAVLVARNRGLLVSSAEPAKKLVLPVYSITSLGQQVLRLGSYETNLAQLRKLGDVVCEMGFEVSLVRCVPEGGGRVRYSEPEVLCGEPLAPDSPVHRQGNMQELDGRHT